MSRFPRILPLPARNPNEVHRASTQLELFFDLISVIAIAAITHGLHHSISAGHGLEKLPIFIFLFVGIWWAWMNFTWFASAFDNDGPVYRLLVMLIMCGELVFAGGASHIFESHDFSWGLVGWCIMRIGMAALWLRASANPQYSVTTRRYAVGILLAQCLWVLFFFVLRPQSSLEYYGLGLLAFLFEFSVPVFAEKARDTPFHRHHMIERYGLLTIISLGEIMLAISMGFGQLYGEHPSWAAVSTAISALFIVFSLFWLYFEEREHLPKREFSTVFIWGYGHLFIFGSLAVIGAAIAAELDRAEHHGHATQAEIAWWLGLPMALYFLTLCLVRDRHFRLGICGYAMPCMAALAIAAAALGMGSWIFAVIAVVSVIWRLPVREQAVQEARLRIEGAPLPSGRVI